MTTPIRVPKIVHCIPVVKLVGSAVLGRIDVTNQVTRKAIIVLRSIVPQEGKFARISLKVAMAINKKK